MENKKCTWNGTPRLDLANAKPYTEMIKLDASKQAEEESERIWNSCWEKLFGDYNEPEKQKNPSHFETLSAGDVITVKIGCAWQKGIGWYEYYDQDFTVEYVGLGTIKGRSLKYNREGIIIDERQLEECRFVITEVKPLNPEQYKERMRLAYGL